MWSVHAEINVGVLPWTWLGDFKTKREAEEQVTKAMKSEFTWEYKGEFDDEIIIGRALRCRMARNE